MKEQHQTHTYLETDGEFKMRELDKGDLEQFNSLLQYAFQVTSYDLFQTGWKQDEIKCAKRPILEEAYVIGWFYHDKLASMAEDTAGSAKFIAGNNCRGWARSLR